MNIPPITFGNFKNAIPQDRNLKDRYWKFLFDNLQRAVDELYATCEADESVLQCREVVMVLERCTKDFYALIERFKLLQEFEQADSDRKPSSLAWEVRTTVPFPKSSELSPRRLGGRLSKRTLFNVSCVPTSAGSQQQLPLANVEDPLSAEVRDDAQESSSLSLVKPLEINVSDERCQSLNNENRHNIDDGEWRLVKTNKHSKRARKFEHSQEQPERSSQAEISFVTTTEHESVQPDVVEEKKTELPTPVQQDDLALPRSRTSTLSTNEQRRQRHGLPEFFTTGLDDMDMDMSIELDEALMSALTAEDELNKELREELNQDDQEDFTDDQSDSWLSVSDSIRIPGRGVELHEKLMSPARRNKPEKINSNGNSRAALAEQLAEKQLKVMELRERRQKDKIERCSLLSKRVEEVRTWKNELMQEKKRAIEAKMEAAEQRRLHQLQQIVKKAHDEEAKGSEIAFINNIEAESRKQEIQTKYQLWRKRLLELADEQNKRRDAAAARKSAASDRKRALDAEKQHRMEELLEKQKERERKAEKLQVERMQERVAFSRAREKEHEERMEAIRMADESRTKELRERIYHKQDECARRHSELIEQRRERALALSTQNLQSPRHVAQQSTGSAAVCAPLSVDQRKFCIACSAILDSDLALAEHLKNRQHRQLCGVPKGSSEILCLNSMQSIVPFSLTQQQHLSASLNQPKLAVQSENSLGTNRQPQKKRTKKYRQRLAASLPKESDQIREAQTGRLGNVITELERLVESLTSSQVLSDRLLAVERLVLELARLIEKQSLKDKNLKIISALSILGKVLMKYLPLQSSFANVNKNKSPTETSDRLIVATLQCFVTIFHISYESSAYLLCYESQLIPAIFETLMNGVEVLSQTAVSSLRLGGQLFEALHSKLIAAIAWSVSVFNSLSTALTSAEGASKVGNVDMKEFAQRCHDCVSLLVASGFVDRTAQLVAVATYLTEFGDDAVFYFLKAITNLLAAACRLSHACQCVADKTEETILFVASLRFTDLSGAVSLVYALMLKETGLGKASALFGGSGGGESQFQTDIPKQAVELLLQTYEFLTAAAILDPVLLQTTLVCDSPLLLQFRQASSYIICQANATNLTSTHVELINQVIICIGVFSLQNHTLAENVLASGQPPTILQQLCQLPIRYFTDPELNNVLLPTLLAATFKCESCLAILKSELSPHLLVRFLQEQSDKANKPTSATMTSSQPSFNSRFPQSLWKEAFDWFSPSSAS